MQRKRKWFGAIAAIYMAAPIVVYGQTAAPGQNQASWAARKAQYEAALENVSKSIVASPHLLEAYRAEASILLQIGRQTEAAHIAEQIVAANSDQPQAYEIAAGIYARLDLREKALAMIDRWIALRPNSVDPQALVMRSSMRPWNDFRGRESDIAPLLADNRDYLPALYAKGAVEYDRGDFASAADTYLRIRRLGQATPATFDLLGFSLFRAGKLKDADAAFENARRRSNDPTTLASLCWGKVTFGIALDRALEECNSALAIAPDDPNILDSRAMIYLRLGKLDQALTDFDRALGQFDELPNSLFGRAIIRARTGDLEAARKDAEAARRLWPNVDNTFAHWGFAIPQEIGFPPAPGHSKQSQR